MEATCRQLVLTDKKHFKANITVLNCVLGKHFTNMLILAVVLELENIVSSPRHAVKTTNSVVELGVLSKATALGSLLMSALTSPCAVNGLVVYWVLGFCLLALWDGLMRIT